MRTRGGFTIVELLIVVVVIAILAGITIVSYNGITGRARDTALQSDLKGLVQQLFIESTTEGAYPETVDELQVSDGSNVWYEADGDSFCVTVYNDYGSYYAREDGVITEGECEGADIGDGGGSILVMQEVTAANCPTNRTLAKDARDNHTYWIKKYGSLCWMLTNLGYSGGGSTTYSDTRSLTNGTSGTVTYTTPSYYVYPSTVNFTVDPNEPSTSTNGTGQYGYAYNWCAAMGGQATSACTSGTSPAPNTTITVCPANWRLPVGNGGELAAVNTIVNGGLDNTDAGLRTNLLAQYGGGWYNGFGYQGEDGYYWTSSSNAGYAYYFYMHSDDLDVYDTYEKLSAMAVRCVAA